LYTTHPLDDLSFISLSIANNPICPPDYPNLDGVERIAALGQFNENEEVI